VASTNGLAAGGSGDRLSLVTLIAAQERSAPMLKRSDSHKI
jgi:hypothetical protein